MLDLRRDFSLANAGGTKGSATAKVIAAAATTFGGNTVAMCKLVC